MAPTITNVEVFGFNGNGKVKRVRRDSSKIEANQRFPGLKPNRLLITGTNLQEVQSLKLEYSTGVNRFSVIDEDVFDSNTKLNVWFVVWADATADKKDLTDLGDLTVTVETVAPTDVTGTDDNVPVED